MPFQLSGKRFRRHHHTQRHKGVLSALEASRLTCPGAYGFCERMKIHVLKQKSISFLSSHVAALENFSVRHLVATAPPASGLACPASPGRPFWAVHLRRSLRLRLSCWIYIRFDEERFYSYIFRRPSNPIQGPPRVNTRCEHANTWRGTTKSGPRLPGG